MRTVRVLEAAANEAAEAAAWYERARPGLGTKFQRAVDAVLDLLELEIVPLTSLPGMAGKRDAQRILLKRFPHAIVVREHDSEVIVIAVAHQSRRPGYWRDRESIRD
ncbi:MAG: hypothetical protein U9R74_00550 [Pseudomonadota bacterium]|nr:hypothetical protein [Pseudomonadota bacterium]